MAGMVAGAEQLLEVFHDFADQGDEDLARFIVHCGITLADIEVGSIWSAILKRYRLPGADRYDADLLAHHLATWPPIVARVKELAH